MRKATLPKPGWLEPPLAKTIAHLSGKTKSETLLPMKLHRAAANATPTMVGVAGFSMSCMLPIGTVFTTPSKLACDLRYVTTFGLDGTIPQVLIDDTI